MIPRTPIARKKRPNRKRYAPRRNRESPEETLQVREQLILRSLGHCEGARIRRGKEIIIEHAPDCSGVADWDHGHAAHNKSRGAGGKFELDNLRWVTAACHRWEHSGGKVVARKDG